MTRYTNDNGVISSSVPISAPREREHSNMFGVYRGVIVKVIYPDAPDNHSKKRVEYVVKVNGQEYYNAIDMRSGGGVNNYSERVKDEMTTSLTGALDKSTYDENTDGEAVFVQFIQGHGDYPLIIGSDAHPSQYKANKKADGPYDINEFNGVEAKIDKDGGLNFTIVGKKTAKGAILNQTSVGAMIKVSGKDGSIFIKASSKGFINIDKDGSIKVFGKDGTYMSIDAKTGTLLAQNKAGHVLSMDANEVNLAHKSGTSAINLSGGFTGSKTQMIGDTAIIRSKETNIDSGTVNVGGNANSVTMAEPLATLFDAHTHMTPLGPTTPPIPPFTASLINLNPITAFKSLWIKMKGNL